MALPACCKLAFSGLRLIFSCVFVASAVSAFAGDNTLILEQRGIGNSLTSDQSKAQSSTVGGLKLSGAGNLLTLTTDETALQQTQGPQGSNSASLEFGSGSESAIYLLQQNTGTAVNDANVSVEGGGRAALAQVGTGNTATLSVEGLAANGLLGDQLSGNFDGAIIQIGDRNRAALTTTVTTQGAVIQEGDNNSAAVDLANATAGTALLYRQVGDGLSASTPVQVLTNTTQGGVIVITQQAGVGSQVADFGPGAAIVNSSR